MFSVLKMTVTTIALVVALVLSKQSCTTTALESAMRRRTVPPQKARPTPPGPPSLPSLLSNGLGSLPIIGLGKAIPGIGGPPPHERMHQLAKREYGDVMTLEMGREPWVILSSPEVVHEAFVVKAKEFSGRPMVPSMSISSKGKGFARATLDPSLIKLRQKAFGDLFDAKSVQRARVHFEDETQCLVDYLVSSSSKGGGVEIRPALRRAVTNMVLRYAFSARVPYKEEDVHSTSTRSSRRRTNIKPTTTSSTIYTELVDVVEELWEELTSTQTFLTDLAVEPRLADAYYKGVSPIPSLVQRRDSLIQKLISQRREEHLNRATAKRQQNNSKTTSSSSGGGEEHHNNKDMLDVLLEASLPESDVMYTLVDLFVAGVNTVSTTLEWILLLTADKPHYQTRARKDAIILANHDDESSSLLYVDALIKETLRYKPPLLLPRRCIADTIIGNFRIPAGRVVLANNWSLTRDEHWWKNPYSFRPERWLEEEKSKVDVPKNVGGPESCKFIPYSIGRRACPGSKLAEAELSTAVQGLLCSVSWSRMEPSIDLSENYSLTLSPTKSQSLTFRRLKTK